MKRDAIQFKPLRECDSLVARINQIWGLKPSLVQFEYEDEDDHGNYHPDIYHLTPEQAATELARLDRIGAEVTKTPEGYRCYIEIPKGSTYGRWD